jgi:hypothetical protein
MEARPSGQFVVQVAVVYPVQSPEYGNGVDHDVLRPDDQVHDHHRQRDGQGRGHGVEVQQAPAVLGRLGGQAHRRRWEEQAQDQGIQADQRQIVAPAQPTGQA